MIIKHGELIKDLKKLFYDCEIDDMERIAEHRNYTLQNFIIDTILTEVNKCNANPLKEYSNLTGHKFEIISYDGSGDWKELQEDSLEELSEKIDELESEMLNDEIDEKKIFEILDELKSIQSYMEDGITKGYTRY